MVTDHEAVSLGSFVGVDDAGTLAQQRIDDSTGNTGELRALEQDRVFDLGMFDRAPVANGSERADVGVFDHGVLADEHGPTDDRTPDLGSFAHDYAELDTALGVQIAL